MDILGLFLRTHPQGHRNQRSILTTVQSGFEKVILYQIKNQWNLIQREAAAHMQKWLQPPRLDLEPHSQVG